MPRVRKQYGIPELNNLLRNVSAKLVQLREKEGLSQSELAKRAGIGKSTINEIENRVATDIQFSTLCQLARALDVRFVDFLAETDFQLIEADKKEFVKGVDDLEKTFRLMERLRSRLK